MHERAITIDGETHDLGSDFLNRYMRIKQQELI